MMKFPPKKKPPAKNPILEEEDEREEKPTPSAKGKILTSRDGKRYTIGPGGKVCKA